MEKELMKTMTQISFLAVLIYVFAAVTGKREQMKVRKHPKDRKQDPDSNVWLRSGVTAPLASPYSSVNIR